MVDAVRAVNVLIVHSSAELYGSDKSLLDFVQLRPVEMQLTVVLPEQGPLVLALRAAGVEVLVGEVCKVQRDMLSPAGAWRTLSAAVRSVRFLSSLHRQRRFSLVYSNSVAILGGALSAKFLRIPHVWHVREILAGSGRLTWGFRQLVRALSARVICNSAETRRWIAGPSPTNPADYAVVWNGYEHVPKLFDRIAVRHALGASVDEVLFVLVGRINAWKGQRLLVDAFAEVVKVRTSKVRLAIVGSAFAGQEHFETELAQAIVASGCSERICVQPFRTDVEAVWDAADVVVVPSTEPEPFGRVAIEAMAFAKPVVAAAHGGLIEIVQHEVTGLLVTPRDSTALAQALIRLSAEPALRWAMGSAGQVRQQIHFSLPAYVNQVAHVLLLASEKNPHA